MRVLYLETEDGGHPPCLVCYKRKCVGCDLRFQCNTVSPELSPFEEYVHVTEHWINLNLHYHCSGINLIWDGSKSGSNYKWGDAKGKWMGHLYASSKS
jgi:hypothetical protein